jgi:hypothetical protein
MTARTGIFPQPEPDACEQLGQQERLGQVILGAAFEAIDLRGGVVYARHHDHRLVWAGGQDAVQDVHAVHVRHYQVQDDEVVCAFPDLRQSLRSS